MDDESVSDSEQNRTTTANMSVPYRRLSGFYLFYFAVTGAFVPYWSVYLKEIGYGAVAIGIVMALPMATKIFAPYIWGAIADFTGRRVWTIRLAAILAASSMAVLAVEQGIWWLIIVITIFSFFWNAALPQFEAVTLNHLYPRGEHYYSLIRLWGSVGFILSVLCLGWAFDWFSIIWLPSILTILLTLLWVMSLKVPEAAMPAINQHEKSFNKVIRQPTVVFLLLTCFLIQASHGPYYSFFTLYLHKNGYGSGLSGLLWSIGVFAEIAIFMFMHRLLPWFGARKLLLFATVITTVRWSLIAGWANDLPVLVFGQTLHAASYGIYHVASISLIHRYFPGRLQGRGQALYSSLSFGLGGALGSIMSGYAWNALGPSEIYWIAAALALLSTIIVYWGVGRPLPAS